MPAVPPDKNHAAIWMPPDSIKESTGLCVIYVTIILAKIVSCPFNAATFMGRE